MGTEKIQKRFLKGFVFADGTRDEPYDGLDEEIAKETLSLKEQKRLTFIRWGLRHNKGHFHEFLDDEE